tara:strand:+ start:123 stop:1472 length:1350 start_codon:yes stop_codon:yes gene_type:complete
MALLTESQQQYYDGNNFGGYQFISLDEIINNFRIAYVGENKIIPKVKRTDIAFHAQRAIQELSFDTFKSIKAQEITLPPSNTMVLPQDYVNYTKICWVDDNGIERPLYPTRHTSNPIPIYQNSDGEYKLTAVGDLDSDISNTTFSVVLDGEYKNIQVGMRVVGPYIPVNTFVRGTSNNNSITTVTLEDNTGAGVLPTQTNADVTLTFMHRNRDLVLEEETAVVVENLDWNTTDLKITANAAADITDVKVGMLVSHDNFPEGTVVTNVSGITIVVSEPPDTTVLSNGGEVTFISTPKNSSTWDAYKSDTSSSTDDALSYNHDTDIYDLNVGQRYGLEPQLSQTNGTYYIDGLKGLIHFSSNISGKTVILKYISDGLGTDEEMIVHKFAEEAMYKSIAYAILSTTLSGQVLVPRFKQEKFAAIRQAKLRLSNIKIDELTQIMRGKSKWIKR